MATPSDNGVFRTAAFQVPLRLGPAPGWRVRAEQPRKVEFVLDSDPRPGVLTFLMPTGVYDPARRYGNADAAEAGLESLPPSLDAWLHAHPRLIASPSTPVMRSGLNGITTTVSVTGGDPFADVSVCDAGCALLFSYGPHTRWFLGQGNGNRVEIFDFRGQPLVISIETPASNLETFEREVDALLATLQFG